MQFCGENDIETCFTQYGNRVNKIEETITHGKRVIEIQIGDPTKEGFREELLGFLEKLRI